MRIWPFRKKLEHDLGEYTEPTFRGVLTMLIFIIVVLVVILMAFVWAIQQPGFSNLGLPGLGQPPGQAVPN
jgi:hypothetical protein